MQYLYGELQHHLPVNTEYRFFPYSPLEHVTHFGHGLHLNLQNRLTCPLNMIYPHRGQPLKALAHLVGEFSIDAATRSIQIHGDTSLEIIHDVDNMLKFYHSYVVDLVPTDGLPRCLLKPRDYDEITDELVMPGFLRAQGQQETIDFVTTDAFFATGFEVNPMPIMQRGAYAYTKLRGACATSPDHSLEPDGDPFIFVARADLLLKTPWDPDRPNTTRLDVNGALVYHDSCMDKVLWNYYDEAAFKNRFPKRS